MYHPRPPTPTPACSVSLCLVLVFSHVTNLFAPAACLPAVPPARPGAPLLKQSVRSDMDAGRAAAGLPVADWSESHMVNVRLVVDVLIALGLVKSDYNTVEQAAGWPMDVHPPSERHGG